MDSFFEQPRRPALYKSNPAEHVQPLLTSNVSMLHENLGNFHQNTNKMSYNAWKLQGREQKENKPPPQQLSLLKKQVRFQSPQLQSCRPLKCNVLPNKNIIGTCPSEAPRKSDNVLHTKPFEKVYMANVPNRILDLSMLDPAPPQNKTSTMHAKAAALPSHLEISAIPEEPRRLLSRKPTWECQAVPEEIESRQLLHTSPTWECETVPAAPYKRTDEEPTIKDLLTIIKQQNEQLMCLQKQVNTLLEEKKVQPQLYPSKEPAFASSGLPKFTLDVMTSFEVSLVRPDVFGKKKFGKGLSGEEPKIKEITAEENMLESTKNSVSLVLSEPLTVQEEYRSPENSIHVDMQDYSSDSESEETSSHIGWTIYNKVMDQVNCLLQRSNDGHEPETRKLNNVTLHQVKEATMKHLRNVGVNISKLNVSEPLGNETSSEHSPSEISFVVKQLLMKYLPDEHLAKLQQKTKPPKDNYPKNLIQRRPEFSLATLQYMEKYNLLDKDTGKKCKSPISVGEKLLDKTNLMQQPKLL